MKSAIFVFVLGSFGLLAANAADYGSEHQGFVKVQQALDDAELAKHLETFRQFCASGGLISFLDARKVQLPVGSLWAGAPKKALSLGSNPPWPICLLCDPSCMCH